MFLTDDLEVNIDVGDENEDICHLQWLVVTKIDLLDLKKPLDIVSECVSKNPVDHMNIDCSQSVCLQEIVLSMRHGQIDTYSYIYS